MLFRILCFFPKFSRFRACDTVFAPRKPLAQIVGVFSLTPKRHDSVVGALDARSLEQRILVAKEGKNKSRAFIYVIVSK